MERLTYDFCVGDKHCWQVKGADNLECREVCRNQGENGCTDCPIAKAFDRLAAYEETGLEPEEIMEAVKLFSGTNVDVPKEIIGWVKRATWHCKRLAELTRLVSFDRLRQLAEAEKEGQLVVLPCKVGDKLYDITLGEVREKTVISLSMFVPESVNHLVIHAEDFRTAITSYELQDIGETFFLTREAAEAALEAQRGETDA